MKNKYIIGAFSIILLIVFANVVEANSPPPHYVNWEINWIAVIYSFTTGTLMEIILGYFLLHDKMGWLKALIVANIFSYPIFIGILSLGGSFHSLLSGEQIMQVIIITGELLVIFLETIIIRKILKNVISFRKSLFITTILNLSSWILGSQLVIFLFTESFPFQVFDIIYSF